MNTCGRSARRRPPRLRRLAFRQPFRIAPTPTHCRELNQRPGAVLSRINASNCRRVRIVLMAVRVVAGVNGAAVRPAASSWANASEQARLVAIQGVLMTRLLASQPTPTDESADRLLTAEEVARALGVTRRWVQRRARRLPLARRLSAHAVRYSESGLKRWMANRRLPIA